MNRPGAARIVAVSLLAAFAAATMACSDSAATSVGAVPAILTKVAGDSQTATVRSAVAVPPTVLVEDAHHQPMPGVAVSFAALLGGGSVTGVVATSNSLGTAAAGSWVLGTTAGTNTLVATVRGMDSVTFTATATPPPTSPDSVPAALTLSAPESLPVGQAVTIRVSAVNALHQPVAVPPLTWSSSDTEIARVSAAGLLTAVGLGTAGIRAQSGNLAATTKVRVTQAAVPPDTNLLVMPQGEFGDTIQLALGTTVQMSSYLYSDRPPASPLSPDTASFLSPVLATWTSTRPDVATVSAIGITTAVQEGTSEIRAAVGRLMVSRYIRVTPSQGTISLRFVHAGAIVSPVTLHQNVGAALSLAFGDVRAETASAGTVQVTLDGYPLYLPDHLGQGGGNPPFGEAVLDLQQFTGFLPAGTQATIVVTGGPGNSNLVGPVALAPLWDWNEPVATDSARVRVVLATVGGYNVYFVPPGAPKGTVFLQGCYLDWPYGVTDYAARAAGDFDIVLEPKWDLTREAGRFRVTPQPGHATTYILVGTQSTLQVWPLVDH